MNFVYRMKSLIIFAFIPHNWDQTLLFLTSAYPNPVGRLKGRLIGKYRHPKLYTEATLNYIVNFLKFWLKNKLYFKLEYYLFTLLNDF